MTELQRLRIMDTVLYLEVSNGLKASAAQFFLQHNFYNYPDPESVYKTNVANTFTYHAIDMAVSMATIGAFEVINEEKGRGEFSFEIPGLHELKCHRTFYAHSSNIKWEKKWMQEFVNQGLHVKDSKAFRMFQVRESITDEIISQSGGGTIINPNEAVADKSVREMIKLALRISLKDHIELPPDIDDQIITFFSKFNENLRSQEW